MKRLLVLLLCLSLAAVLASCRRGDAGPVSQPTLTPTPRSTSLPPVATPIPVGAEGNAVRMVFAVGAITSTEEDEVQTAIDGLQAALLEETSLIVEVTRAATDAEAITALCDSVAGTVTVAWLNGVAYTAAAAQNCGTAALQVAREGSTTERALLVRNTRSGISSVSDMADKNFCRVSASDFYTWLLPSIMLATSGFSTASFASITDYDDVPELIAALEDGDCDAAGVSQSAYTTAGSRVDDLPGGMEIPIGVLTYPESFPLGQAQALTDALIAIANGTRGTLLAPLLGQDALVEVETDTLAAVRTAITRAGVDLSEMAGS
ncbi:MAG: PhnD/SsuA/transferrin family substrate-binding protein [Chloroflexi bacterium]|uniref:phosphate/phosphite/phosphonate ABC transporter substrate-binding protein n=1 Tax=Candidatus Flexifilum breve TaxID=3140694 RepID=UPI0031355495|nr:PhnD/SsuA/transferrin family substrate-binding protein [Chloroflexota bacterium]